MQPSRCARWFARHCLAHRWSAVPAEWQKRATDWRTQCALLTLDRERLLPSLTSVTPNQLYKKCALEFSPIYGWPPFSMAWIKGVLNRQRCFQLSPRAPANSKIDGRVSG